MDAPACVSCPGFKQNFYVGKMCIPNLVKLFNWFFFNFMWYYVYLFIYFFVMWDFVDDDSLSLLSHQILAQYLITMVLCPDASQ